MIFSLGVLLGISALFGHAAALRSEPVLSIAMDLTRHRGQLPTRQHLPQRYGKHISKQNCLRNFVVKSAKYGSPGIGAIEGPNQPDIHDESWVMI